MICTELPVNGRRSRVSRIRVLLVEDDAALRSRFAALLSDANGPKTLPKLAVKLGHRRRISKLRIVPVTTPAANRAAITFVQRFANVR